MKQSKPPEQQSDSTGASPESGDSHALSKTQKARRRLLGASLGAPVIYTLSSGALQAASSSYCEYREESTEPFETPLGPGLSRGAGKSGDAGKWDDAGKSSDAGKSGISESPSWGTVREDGFVSDGTQWVSGSCWSSMQMSVIDSSTKIV